MTHRPAWRSPAWTDTSVGRVLFVHGLRTCAVTVHVVQPDRRRHRGGFAVKIRIAPPGLASRRVRISFARGGEDPLVHVDGLTESQHRYPCGALCMWYPYDPPELRWTRADSARTLLGHIVAHLVREEWWRRTGEWVGAEAPHESPAGARMAAGIVHEGEGREPILQGEETARAPPENGATENMAA